MVLKITALLAAPILLLGIAAGATGVLLVEVREGGEDGTHLVIPVPLVLARGALAFAPDEAQYVACSEFERYAPLAGRVLHELQDAPDGVLVEVRDGNTSVLVRKHGRFFTVDVQDGADLVNVRIPIEAALDMVESHDGEGFRVCHLLKALQGAPRGQLVHVRDGMDEVRIRLL